MSFALQDTGCGQKNVHPTFAGVHQHKWADFFNTLADDEL
jgi:hypothetical protein